MKSTRYHLLYDLDHVADDGTGYYEWFFTKGVVVESEFSVSLGIRAENDPIVIEAQVLVRLLNKRAVDDE